MMATAIAPAITHVRDFRAGQPDTAPSSFVAIDFETANPSRSSPIQIGIVRVLDGVLGEPFTVPIMPPEGHRRFAPGNQRIHGLGPAYIHGAPEWPAILERLIRFTTSVDGQRLELVAHNAAFEKSVIEKTSEACGLAIPDFRYFCTVKHARKVLPHLSQHKLDVVARYYDLPAFAHHDAGADALAGAQITIRLAEDERPF